MVEESAPKIAPKATSQREVLKVTPTQSLAAPWKYPPTASDAETGKKILQSLTFPASPGDGHAS